MPLIMINNSYLQFFGAVLILIFGLYLNSKYLDKRDFSGYGLVFKKETFTHLCIGILIGFISVLFMFFIGKATGILLVSDAKSIPHIELLLLFALKMLLVGILEETFFRGYLFTTIYDGLLSGTTKNQAFWISFVVSSALFGLAHISTSNASILSTIFLSINGMVWCIPFVITKNLGLSIGLHTAWNFTQTQIGFTMSGNKAIHSFYRIEDNGFALLTGGEYGPEAGVLGLIGFMFMLLLSLMYLRFTKKTVAQ
ncbi:CPBP family intramembrane glutamic endopeptidase [Aquimarina atlantica]|nr:CPBP family intramembrane glutamic endopeptidase [Aquimarina atlantica]